MCNTVTCNNLGTTLEIRVLLCAVCVMFNFWRGDEKTVRWPTSLFILQGNTAHCLGYNYYSDVHVKLMLC